MAHNKKDGHVMLMAPNNGGPSGLPGSKSPSGMAHPAVKVPPSNGNGDGGEGGDPPEKDPKDCRVDEVIEKPIPVVLTASTLVKLVAALLLPLLGAVSGFFYWYHKTNTHIEDPNIHLGKLERTKLETKGEAAKARAQLKTDIVKHFDVKVEKIGVKQEKQFQKLSKELRAEQKTNFRKVLNEIRKSQ